MLYLSAPARLLTLLSVLLIVVAGGACGGEESASGAVVEAATAVAARPAVTTSANGSVTVDAAGAFLDSLTDGQRSEALYDFDDPVRSNWSNLPAGVPRFDRNGVRVGDLDSTQTEAMLVFLSSALSVSGYEKVLGVLGADAFLREAESEDRFGDQNYWLAFFGEPSGANIWAWQFGGHHLAINVTVADGRNYLSPTFIGVEPASFVAGEVTVAPLSAHLKAGLAVIDALDDGQQAKGKLSNRPDGIYAGAGEDGLIPPVEGSGVTGWSDLQRQLVLDAISQWVGMLDRSSSRARMAEIESELGAVIFAWHRDAGGSLYYRIQGPSLIIEFLTEGDPSESTSHYHTVYRNPVNEYGRAVYRER